MKTTQAWTWLVAAVLATGLNASYHDGGLPWAHQIVERVADNVEQGSTAVLALASGQPRQFLAEARQLMVRNETASCRLTTALARVQTRIARSETGFARFQAMSAREEAQLARIEANREMIEAQQEAQSARIEAQRARVKANVAAEMVRVRVRSASFVPVNVRVPVVCPRIRVNLPRPPMVRIPAPVIHLDTVSSGPV